LAEAVTLVLTTFSKDAHAYSDRAWIPAADSEPIREIAEIQDALQDLSPVSYRDEDEDAVWLPLPVAGQLARRIAERNPDAVVAAVEASLKDLMSRGYLAIAPKYKPGWDMAVRWAGRTPVTLPEPEASPVDAYKRLWERLRGMGVATTRREQHAWRVQEEMLLELGPLLGGATRYSGRLTLRAVSDGYVRVALETGYRSPAMTPEEIRSLALSLSRPQQAVLGELRDVGPTGAPSGALAAHRRTVESLVSWGLAERIDVEADDEPTRDQLRLTDAGWRVPQHLGPRSA